MHFDRPQAIAIGFDYLAVNFGDDSDLSSIGAPPSNTQGFLQFETIKLREIGGLCSIRFDSVPVPYRPSRWTLDSRTANERFPTLSPI